MNYFEFYNIPVSFNPNQVEIKKLFYEYSKTYHPDFHTDSSELTKEERLQKSAFNNEAYKTLKNFDKRLKYVLEIKEVIKPTDKDNIPQDFLIEMMDINERIMEVQFDFNEKQHEQILGEIKQFEDQLTDSVDGLLDKSEHSPEELNTVKSYYYKRKYLKRIQENLEKLSTQN